MRLITVSLIFIFVSSWGVFSEGLTKIYTVETLIERALQYSDALDAANQHVEKVRWAKQHASRWQNPSLGADIGRKSEGNESGPLYEIKITQPFYFPGKQKLRSEIVGFDEEAALLSLEERRLFIRYEVTRLAYAYVAAQKLIEHTQERVERFRLMKKYMKGRPFASPQAQAEKTIVENKLLFFERDLLQLQRKKGQAWAKLNLYLNFPEKVQIDLKWVEQPLPLTKDQMFEKVLADNIHLKKLKQEREKVLRKKRLSEKEVWSDFSLSGFYGEEEAQDEEQTYGVGFSVELPLFSRNKPLSKSLEAEVKEKDARIKFEENLLKQKLSSLYAQYETTAGQLGLFPLSLISELDQKLESLDKEFLKNRIGLLTYLEVESEVYESHLAVYESQVDFIKVHTRILSLVSKEDFEIGGEYVQ
jgi:outer membrane protein TolC